MHQKYIEFTESSTRNPQAKRWSPVNWFRITDIGPGFYTSHLDIGFIYLPWLTYFNAYYLLWQTINY